MPAQTRPANKTLRPNKTPLRRKGKDGKTVRELDSEEKQRKEDERAQKIRDLKNLEEEQVANLATTATTPVPVPAMKMLRGGKKVGPAVANTTKPSRKRSVGQGNQLQGRGCAGEGDIGTANIGKGGVQAYAPLFAEARPGPLLEHPKAITGSSSQGQDDAVISGKKRQRALPAIQEIQVSL